MSNLMRGLAVAALALLLAVGQARSQARDAGGGFELISAAEARNEARAQAEAPAEVIVPRGAAPARNDAPAIRVVSPAASGVAAPVRIELAFRPAPGTRIVPGTFRVLYGLLKIDLTDRLKKHATVTETGVVVEQAQVPDGQHRLIVQVADDQGNTAEQELRLRVGAAL